MNIKDLRIGDKISYKGEICEIDEIGHNTLVIIRNKDPFIIDIEDIEPIPLTDEILEKLEFNSHKTTDKTYYFFDKLINFSKDIIWTIYIDYQDNDYYFSFHDIVWKKRIKYLHQFQHELYDANIELKIKL